MKEGWNTWDVDHPNGMMHLPSKLCIYFGLYNEETEEHLTSFLFLKFLHHLGMHAPDASYCEIQFRWQETILQLEFAASGQQLACCATPLSNTVKHRLSVTVDTLETGEPDITHHINTSRDAEFITPRMQVFSFDEPLYVSIGLDGAYPLEEAQVALGQNREVYEKQRFHTSGWLQDAGDGIFRSAIWNMIHIPNIGKAICSPRDWGMKDHRPFGSYVLFGWDNGFNALVASLEDSELARSNILTLLKNLPKNGIVPNLISANGTSDDRSGPPVNTYNLLKIYAMSGLSDSTRDVSLLNVAYPILKKWFEWWMPNRDGNGDGLLEWGSDPVPVDREQTWDAFTLKGAMFESGLDNSPMWDDTSFNIDSHTMELSAIGLNSLYALDARALGQLAHLLDQNEDSNKFNALYRTMVERINKNLWDEEAGIYKNRHWSDDFSDHLSPTCFYPMIAQIASEAQAKRMVQEHLLNEEEFWGAYIIPSIARNDPGYQDMTYWRGSIWGPMNYLVYEGLRAYEMDVIASEFAQKSLNLFLQEWQQHTHIYENYNSITGQGKNEWWSYPVYTWGALLGFIAVQEVVDADPFTGGWRFGTQNSPIAEVKNIQVAEGKLSVQVNENKAVKVMLNGELLLTSAGSVKNYTRTENNVAFIPEYTGSITIGLLPASADLHITRNSQIQTIQTDASGQVDIVVKKAEVVKVGLA